MLFGKEEFFLKDHFERHKGLAPAYLCELVVHGFELLSQVASFPVRFRFKGGNSLWLILDDPQRFSIDIDIDTTETKENLISIMEQVQKRCSVFSRLEIRRHKTKPWLPMISFNLFFRSFYQKPEDSFIMFDAVLKDTPQPGLRQKIRIGDLYSSDQEVEINTPSVLISDKLLTIGPSTLGIPLGKGKEAQRLKHVFDISRLSCCSLDRHEMVESMKIYLQQENDIQKKNFKLSDVREDTIRFCEAVLPYPELPVLEQLPAEGYIYEIVKGFSDFKKHLFKTNYTWARLKEDMKLVRDLIFSIPGDGA
ncbi:MAG: nucleotidyl transferase AbiEii/AbiGii toxin family protein [bacterium]|nr:nucleotidyl transferase AbiEii/AbiGii toxin family protein [bacterium]